THTNPVKGWPYVGGSGDINKLRSIFYECNIKSELENFWKLETIGIQGSPQADDDQALKHFKRTIIKQYGRYQ
ncbi:hypothetical protein WUBG_13224, partial [Wuchereria bancrofti]